MAENLDLNKDGKLDLEDAKVAADMAKEYFEKVKETDVFAHFKDYNVKLVAAFSDVKDVKPFQEVIGLLFIFKAFMGKGGGKPFSAAMKSFVLANTVAFWLGVISSLITLALGGGYISLAWNLGVGYIIAYLLYVAFATTPNTKLIAAGALLLALYILFNIWMALTKLIFIVPAVFYGLKAFVDLIQLANGVTIYMQTASFKQMEAMGLKEMR